MTKTREARCTIEIWHVVGIAVVNGKPYPFDLPLEASSREDAVAAIGELCRARRIQPLAIDAHRCEEIERDLAEWSRRVFEHARKRGAP